MENWVKNLLDIDDHYIKYPKDEWGGTDLNNHDMVNPFIEIQKIVNPKKVIEIGMWAGHSALLMMTVFKNLQSLVSYDPHPVSERNAKQIKKFWPQHTYYKDAIWDNEDRHSDIDLIFVDGCHAEDHPTRDLHSAIKIKTRYILVDNLEHENVSFPCRRMFRLYNVKHEPKFWFYTNTKYSTVKEGVTTSPGIMGLFKIEPEDFVRISPPRRVSDVVSIESFYHYEPS